MKNNINDPRIDAALNSYPTVETPNSLVSGSLKIIRMEEIKKAARPRWGFVHYAVAIFLTIFSFSVISITPWTINQIDPLLIDQIRLEISFYMLYLNPEFYQAAILLLSGTAIIVSTIFLGLTFWNTRPKFYLN